MSDEFFTIDPLLVIESFQLEVKVSNNDIVILYHATNLLSARKMIKKGMGFSREDYIKQIIKPISKLLDVDSRRVLSSLDRRNIISEEPVSFFPWKQVQVLKHYGSFGGELKGIIVDHTFKAAARALGISVNSPKVSKFRKKFEKEVVGLISKPVIVKVEVPKRLLVYTPNSESFTKINKLDSKYIKAILGFSNKEDTAKVLWKENTA